MAYSGKFVPSNKSKYKGNYQKIEYRSSWELSFMRWCDNNPHVVRWNSEEIVIPYVSSADGGKKRRYFMDFFVELSDGRKFIFEIKPHKETMPPEKPKRLTEKAKKRLLKEVYTFQVNQDKWTAAIKFAKQKGWIFKVLTEHGLRKLIGLRV
ncbi:head completion protein [Vibrio phage phi-Grn1]|uniref:Head completion nuclease n=1 Tax=Vibrio phage phi-Grn1 TaxID=1747713 RepID=A0A140B3I9_9CAUD|nr:head completion protein [Vibrio phage phi-Grn1]